jgi:hypothetical protein
MTYILQKIFKKACLSGVLMVPAANGDYWELYLQLFDQQHSDAPDGARLPVAGFTVNHSTGCSALDPLEYDAEEQIHSGSED